MGLVSPRTATASFLIILTSLIVCTGSGSAQPAVADSPAAETAFNAGVTASRQGDWALAVALFEESMLAAPRPATAYNLAIAHAHLSQYASAIRCVDVFRELADPVRHAEPLRELALLREEALAHVSALTLRVVPVAAELRVDGRTLEGASSADVWLDPGSHRVEARADGFASRVLDVELVAGQHAVIAIELVALAVEEGDASEPPSAVAEGQAARGSGHTPPVVTTPRTSSSAARSALEWGALSLGAVALGAAFTLDVLAFRHAENLRGYDPTAAGFLNAALQYRRIRGAGLGMGIGGGTILGAAVSSRAWFDTASFRWGALTVGAASLVVGTALMVRTPPRLEESTLTAPHRALGALLVGVGGPLSLVPLNVQLRRRHRRAADRALVLVPTGYGLEMVGGF